MQRTSSSSTRSSSTTSSSSAQKKTELLELTEDLNSVKPEIKKEALKKVIANMTVGKDVSPLFQSVIKCIEVNDIEIKKLVYLYIINNSRTRPDDAIMVISLFRKVNFLLFERIPRWRSWAFIRTSKIRPAHFCELLRPELWDASESKSWMITLLTL